MIDALLSKLPIPRPADWGYRVTVCIALSQHRHPADDSIIKVTDNRVSFGDFSGEQLSIKSEALWHNWSVMFAGNDVEHADPIVRVTRKNLRALAEKTKRMITPEDAAEVLDAAYSEHLQTQIENKILRKRGFDAETFRKHGKNYCTPEVYAKTWEQIGKESLSLQFLLTGHDELKRTHIWLVDGENAPTDYNSIGFWAIGSGAPAALNRIALYLGKHGQFRSVEEALYVALTAKFSAEAAKDVGSSTHAMIEKHWSHERDTILIEQNGIDGVRIHWSEYGIPAVPDDVKAALKKFIRRQETRTARLMRSDSQKSKDRQ